MGRWQSPSLFSCACASLHLSPPVCEEKKDSAWGGGGESLPFVVASASRCTSHANQPRCPGRRRPFQAEIAATLGVDVKKLVDMNRGVSGALSTPAAREGSPLQAPPLMPAPKAPDHLADRPVAAAAAAELPPRSALGRPSPDSGASTCPTKEMVCMQDKTGLIISLVLPAVQAPAGQLAAPGRHAAQAPDCRRRASARAL